MLGITSFQKKPDWVLGEKEGKSKSTSEAPPEGLEARIWELFAVWLSISFCLCMLKTHFTMGLICSRTVSYLVFISSPKIEMNSKVKYFCFLFSSACVYILEKENTNFFILFLQEISQDFFILRSNKKTERRQNIGKL